MLLSMLVLSLLFRFKAEDTAASASVGTEQAWAAAMSGVEEALRVAGAVTPGSTEWQDNPGAFRDRFVCDDGVDRWFFTVFSPADGDALSEFRPGLTDEAAKVNINFALLNNIEKLPRFTPALAAALRDFVDEDDTPRSEGAEQDYYSSLPRPYAIRNGPLVSLDELLLVRGFTPALLNGAANAARATGTNDEVAAASDPRPDRGLRQYLTVASYDLNNDNDGVPRTNLNDPTAPLPHIALPAALTNFLSVAQANQIPLNTAADLLEATITVKDEKGAEVQVSSGIGKAELGTVLDLFTTTAAARLEGYINVNTASMAVLATVPGIDEPLAETIVSTRRSISPERRTTIAWLFQEGVVDAEKFKTLAQYLTARSFQYRFQVVGYGLPSGRYRVLDVGIDVANGARRVTYLRDITRLGLPFPLGGDENTSNANTTPQRKESSGG